MDINKSTENNILTVKLNGRLDTNTAPTLQDSLEDEMATNKEVNLDFRSLDYISSAGLRTLLFLHKKASGAGNSLTISNCNEMIQDVFKMTGFINMLNIK